MSDLALNGAQVTSLLEVLDKVALGTITVAGAQSVIGAAFPSVPDSLISSMLAGVNPVPKQKEVPHAPAVDP